MTGDIDRDALLDEWLEEVGFRQLAEDQITVRDYAERAGISMRSAKTHLDEKVTEGLAESEVVYDPRTKHRVTAYRLLRGSSA